MITATERAQQINAATEARYAGDTTSWFCLLVTDAAHWAECGVHTGEDLDQYLAYCDYVESYKEMRNIKPRWLKPSDHTVETWVQMTQDLYDQGWDT